MAKNKNESAEVIIFIEYELTEDKKTIIKKMLKIPIKTEDTDKALRIFENGCRKIFYVSTRNSLVKTKDGYECDVTSLETDLTGMRFELTEASTKKAVLTGKIAVKNGEISDLKDHPVTDVCQPESRTENGE